MNERLKTIFLIGFLGFFGFLALAAALAIPVTVGYKIYQGADLIPSISIVLAYIVAVVISGVVMVRFKRFDLIWGTIFGLLCYGLLFLSVRL